MKLHLIAPAGGDEVKQFGRKVSLSPPLNLAILAGLTPQEVQVAASDENVEPVDLACSADLVGISASTHTVTRAYELADLFRGRGIKVVLGGIHPSSLPDEALLHADSVVVGEAELIWRQLLSDCQNGRMLPVYRSQVHPLLAGLPYSRHGLFKRRRYLFPDTVYTTRGCPNGCAFCSVTSFFGGTYRSRPIDDVIGEIDYLGSPRVVFFVDDNIAAYPRRAKLLFHSLMARKLVWIAQASVTIARDDELLTMAAASGCMALFLGFESLSQKGLMSIGKRTNVVGEYEEAIKRIHSHGIAVFGGFIFGLDHDTEDVFELTVRFAQRARLEGANFNILTPYPGTPLFTSMDREGRILTRDWKQYRNDRVVFEPRLLSAKRLQEGYDWAYREFYSLRSIWTRVGGFHRKRLLGWGLNLNYRSDPISKSVLYLLAHVPRILEGWG